MGNMMPNKLIMVDNYGNEIEIEGTINIIDHVETTSILEENHFVSHILPPTVELEFKGIKNLTKKKFIKLLMSRGIQRNEAHAIAKLALKKYGNYSQSFLLFW